MSDTAVSHLQVLDWGLLAYGEALQLQEALVSERIAELSPDRLILVEHPPVVTIGRSGGDDDLRESEEVLNSKGASVFRVDRGGMTTFHGPGQLVAYPIIKLNRKDLRLYLHMLLESAATVLKNYDLSPEVRSGKPGIWIGPAKIVSVGIACRRWVTYHGIALNVNVDLDWFSTVTPCGDAEGIMTSMEKELGRPLVMGEVKDSFTEAFCRIFGYSSFADVRRRSTERPSWLVLSAASPEAIASMESGLLQLRLNTVCQSARCPNMGECFGQGTATFMILGDTCTRNCRFCAVDKGKPNPRDESEPDRVAEAVRRLGLKHAVITSVTRDDLPDGGSGHFVKTIERIREFSPAATVEVLVPDFGGSLAALALVCEARPDVFNHNAETVQRLYPLVRPQARYRRSLGILEYAYKRGLKVKSGIMLGLGETDREILVTLTDLHRAGCSLLTLGQYLSPSEDHVPIARYVSPHEFESWAEIARGMGFEEVIAGPLVRSSYRAGDMASLKKPPASSARSKE